MNVKQLQQFVEAYLFDRPNLNVARETVYDDVKHVLDELYETDVETYNLFYEMPVLSKIEVLERYLDYQYRQQEDCQINEISAVHIIAPLLAYLWYKIYKGSVITKAIYKTFALIGETFEKIGNFLRKYGSRPRIKYEIINKTLEDCLRKAGIKDTKDVSIPVYSYIRKGTGHVPATQEEIEQANKLRECYTENFIKQLVLLAEIYFQCLKDVDKLNEFAKTAEPDILLTLQAVPRAFKGSCMVIYQQLQDGLDKFRMYVEYIYPDPVDQDHIISSFRNGLSKALDKYRQRSHKK